MGLGQDVNNQKKEMGEMALVAGQSVKIDEVTITAGGITEEQQSRWEQNIGKSVDERSYSHLNPAQKFYLCLAAEGFKLEKAKERAHQLGMTSQELETAQEALALQVNDDDQVTAVTRPSFVGADFVTDPEIKKLLEAAVVKSPRCLYGAGLQGADLRDTDLRKAELWGAQMQGAILRGANLDGAELRNADLKKADLYGADLRWAELGGAQMQGADLYGADLWGAKMQGANLDGADLRLTDLSGADFYNAKNLNTVILTNAFYDAENPPKNLPDNIPAAIKDNLLALDKKSYEQAKELQAAYKEALVTNSQDTITAAEKALTEHLGKCREENAKKAIQQAAPVLGANAIPILVEKLAGSAVRVTDGLPTTAASLSDVSLGGNYSLPAQAKASIEVSNPPSPDNPYNYYRSR
jgi:uncharacterized protein YjbI with pentapeptide repeats